MKVAIASDHGGYHLKQKIIELLKEIEVDYKDFGTFSSEPVDYPDYAKEVAKSVSKGDYDRGILICGTGLGMSICANKYKGIRAVSVTDTFSAKMSREHNDANILALGERVIGEGLAKEIVKVWLETEFSYGRHQTRVNKIRLIEEELYK